VRAGTHGAHEAARGTSVILHLGSDVAVRTRDVVAVLDYDAIRQAAASREFLEVAQSEGKLVHVSDEAVKSAVLTGGNVFLSPISSLTLLRRAASASLEGFTSR
jgi:hypothetical protein